MEMYKDIYPFVFANFAKLWQSKDEIWLYPSTLTPLDEIIDQIEIARPKADLTNIDLINNFIRDNK